MARLAAAFIALVAWVGLAVQFNATLDQGRSMGEAAWILARYFTVLTNLAVAVAMTAAALGGRLRPSLLAGLTLAILLVGAVYVTLLRGLIELSGGALLADALLHKATPVLMLLWWLAFAPKNCLRWRDPALWVLFPVLYLGYALLRGQAEGKFAYPFIDLAALGWSAVAINCAGIGLAFLVAGFALVALGHRLGATSAAL